MEGYYLPDLSELNYVLKNEEVELGPRNTEARPAPYPVIYQGISPGMPEMSPKSPKVGLQLQADLNPRYAVVIGGSMAVLDSMKRDIRPFFVGFSIPATRETRFSLSLNQFWLGAKRYWTFGGKKSGDSGKKQEAGGSRRLQPAPAGQETEEGKGQGSGSGVRKGGIGGQEDGGDRPSGMSEKQDNPPVPPLEKGGKGGFRFYAEIGILAITRANLTTDVWLHVFAPEEGFDFYKVTETESRGSGFATYIGAGGEYFLRRWISLGLDIDYTVGGVGDIKFARYFTVDPLEKDIIRRGDDVLYTDLKKGRVTPLFIDLEGWDFKGQVRFYF